MLDRHKTHKVKFRFTTKNLKNDHSAPREYFFFPDLKVNKAIKNWLKLSLYISCLVKLPYIFREENLEVGDCGVIFLDITKHVLTSM